ncbi:MAG TPA: N-formylglutamate amidohydrolase [Ferrovibrio sp.]|uniref:N-formylglutamate amidohydrolase n=1 Tax=Ferrovibrio sp. TaxID=1917215 RepID=UPI002ED38AD5
MTTEDDPPSFRVLNPQGHAPIVLICDHASCRVPPRLKQLGLSEDELSRHIGWDPGTAAICERLSEALDAPAVLSGVSRLVIDCNRRPDDLTSICEVSDGTAVPGNRNLDEAERERRRQTYFWPYHAAIDNMLETVRQRGCVPALLSIHSFTPRLRINPADRPWHIGVVWDRDDRLAAPLLRALRDEGDLVVGDNEPYSGRTHSGFSIFAHGQDRGLPHAMIEVRQDLVSDAAGAAQWAVRLERCFRRMLAEAGLWQPAARVQAAW